MAHFSNSQLAQKLSDLVAFWSSFNEEYKNWLGGVVGGGPGSDGKYPLTDYTGTESLVDCPAELADGVGDSAAAAAASAASAATSETNAAQSDTDAAVEATTATTQAALADADRIAAASSASDSLDSAVTSIAQANLAATRAANALVSEGNASDSADAALVSELAAGVSADEAAASALLTDPDLFAELSTDNTYGAATHQVFPLHNDAVTPTLAFGDGGYGFYSSSNDVIVLANQGGAKWVWSTVGFYSYSSAGPYLKQGGVSSTVPTVMPRSSDLTTGIGWAGTGQLSLIAGNVEGANIQAAATTFPGTVSASGEITGSNLNVSNWDAAYSWGDHASGGYAASGHNHSGVYEPVDATLVRDDDVGYNKTEWDTAYGWGDHASGGYASGSHLHDGITDTNLLDKTAIETITAPQWTIDNKLIGKTAQSKLGGFFIAGVPEGETLQSPMFQNSAAYNRLRGGSISYTGLDVEPSDANSDTMFNGRGSTHSVYSANVTAGGSFSFEVTLAAALTYGLWVGISFGAGSWRCKDVKIEAYSMGGWVTVIDVTGSTEMSHYGSVGGNASPGTTILRYTLGDFANAAYTRICHIWAANYSVDNLATLYLPLDGGTMYGNLSTSGNVTASNLNVSNWNSAYGWGDHASGGYLTSFTETDPVFVAHDAYAVTAAAIANWNSAYGWGDHASGGYAPTASPTITGTMALAAVSRTGVSSSSGSNIHTAVAPDIEAGHATKHQLTHAWSGDFLRTYQAPKIDGTNEWGMEFGFNFALENWYFDDAITIDGNTYNSANHTAWQSAFGWGDHGSAGYLTSFTETDPVFVAHDAYAVTAAALANWNSAFGWGDHASGGYAASAGSVSNLFAVRTLLLENTELADVSEEGELGFDKNDSETTVKLGSYTSQPIGVRIHDGDGAVATLWSSQNFGATQIGNWQSAYGWGDHASTYEVLNAKLIRHVTTGYDAGSITVASSAPGSPSKGDIWFDTT